MDFDDKLKLITLNIEEVIGGVEICEKLANHQTLRIYWGTAPTKPPHVAYFLPLLKLRDFIKAGCHVTILLADVHSYLDKGFGAISCVEDRTEFYKVVLTAMLRRLGISEADFEFIQGSSFQLDKAYCRDLLKFTTLLSINDAKRAGSEVVKQKDNPTLSSLIYPLMQCLDETALSADIQLGGRDQRKIFMLSRDKIEELGYKKCSYLLNPLIPSLSKQGKMSASDPNGKIELTDTDETICRKVSKAFCADGDCNLDTNPCLAIMKYIIFPTFGKVSLKRDEKYGGDIEYLDFGEIDIDFEKKRLSGVDLKNCLSTYLIELIKDVRDELSKHSQLISKAYPHP